MEHLYLLTFLIGLILLAKSLRPTPKKLAMQAWCDYNRKARKAWEASRAVPPLRHRIEFPRFSKGRFQEQGAVEELLWFARIKYRY